MVSKKKTVTKTGRIPYNANRYDTQDILDEVKREIDVEDYDSILSWVLRQPHSKVKFCVDKATDLPVIVKAVCSALLSDIKWGRSITIQMALERLKGKPVERQVIASATLQPLQIEVANSADNDELSKLLEQK